MRHFDTHYGRFGFDLIYGGDSKQVSLWTDVGVPAMEKAFAGRGTMAAERSTRR